MRIAIVVSGLGAGGAERVVALLARSWVARGWQVTVICFEAAGAGSYHALPPEVRIVRRPPPASRSPVKAAIDLLGRVLFLRRVFGSGNPDVVVSFLTKINGLALLANLGRKRPHLICERNNPERQNVRRSWHVLQDRFAHRAMLILQTEASRGAFSAGALVNARVIPNPVAPSRFPADHSRKTIVGVGRLVEQKGFDLLIEAFAGIACRHPEWTLVIWGEGPLRAELMRQRDRLSLDGRVSLPGLTSEPGAWVRSASIFALSSRYEGFPNVLVEAMSAGMAVAAFDCPFGPTEIVRDGQDGFLVPASDPAALAARLDRLMEDDALRARIGTAAIASVERFSLERVTSLWDEALAAALSTRQQVSRAGDPLRNGAPFPSSGRS